MSVKILSSCLLVSIISILLSSKLGLDAGSPGSSGSSGSGSSALTLPTKCLGRGALVDREVTVPKGRVRGGGWCRLHQPHSPT